MKTSKFRQPKQSLQVNANLPSLSIYPTLQLAHYYVFKNTSQHPPFPVGCNNEFIDFMDSNIESKNFISIVKSNKISVKSVNGGDGILISSGFLVGIAEHLVSELSSNRNSGNYGGLILKLLDIAHYVV